MRQTTLSKLYPRCAGSDLLRILSGGAYGGVCAGRRICAGAEYSFVKHFSAKHSWAAFDAAAGVSAVCGSDICAEDGSFVGAESGGGGNPGRIFSFWGGSVLLLAVCQGAGASADFCAADLRGRPCGELGLDLRHGDRVFLRLPDHRFDSHGEGDSDGAAGARSDGPGARVQHGGQVRTGEGSGGRGGADWTGRAVSAAHHGSDGVWV